MATRTWTLQLDGFKHTVKLRHGYFFGKREIHIDGRLVETSRKLLDMGSDHSFQIAGHTCTIHVRTNMYTFSYDCSIDGVSITSGLPVEFINPPPDFHNGSNLAAIQYRIKMEKQLKGGASWFYVIAALSVLNSLIYILNGGLTFVVGLGITQIVDVIAYEIANLADPSRVALIRTIGLVMNIAIAGGFVGFGLLANNKRRGALITGMVIYGLDMLILVWAADYLSILFHILALFGLFNGLRACKKLKSLEQESTAIPVVK